MIILMLLLNGCQSAGRTTNLAAVNLMPVPIAVTEGTVDPTIVRKALQKSPADK